MVKKTKKGKLDIVKKKSIIASSAVTQKFSKKEVDPAELKSIEDEIREIINWFAVFKAEYDIPDEVTEQILNKLHDIARRVGWLHCK